MSSIVSADNTHKLPVHYTLSFKFAVALTLLVTTLLITSASIVTYTHIGQLSVDIDYHATIFAQLTTPALGELYQKYSPNEAYKFRSNVDSYISKAPDIEQVVLVDNNGNILFDSKDSTLDKAFKSSQGTGIVLNDETRQLLSRNDLAKFATRNSAGEQILIIVMPYFDPNGKAFSLRYLVSYQSLRSEIINSIVQMGLITLVGILLSIGVAILFARRITRPLAQLTIGTYQISQGNYNQKLDVQTGDELEDMARNFNLMAEKLKTNISQLQDSQIKLQDSNLRLEQTNIRLVASNRQLEDSREQLQHSNNQLEKSNKDLADANLKLESANTQLATTNQQLAVANEELKQLDRMKSEFLQTLSHELRTPLSAIKGYNEYLLEQLVGPINAGQEKALKTIHRNIERLTTYINALLDFSRIESGAIPVSIQPFSIKHSIEQVLLGYRTQLEKKSLDLTLDIAANLPLVSGDRDRIGQVIEHLLSNAVKFTRDDGKIKITVQPITDRDKPWVEIAITDTGIGIPQAKIGKIFDKFYQGDSSTTRNYGGMGLGLALVKNILDSHHTTIKVVSQEDLGTTFSFTLPVAVKAEKIDSHPSLAVVEHKKTYLIALIDDEPDINDMLKISLIKEGYNVIDASTGEEGLSLARHHHPDLIILDVRLPDINGFEVLKELKQQPDTANIPVIIMSVLNDPKQSIAQGAVEHLLKPVDFKQLKAKINRYLRLKLISKPTIMVVDDEVDVRQMICDRLILEGYNTLSIADGPSALQLLEDPDYQPALILLDVMMPGQSGWDVISALKANPATTEIPVILVSAKAAEEDIKRGYELGAHDYITKPFEIKDLLAEVKHIIQGQSLNNSNNS